MKVVSIEITSQELYGCILDKHNLPSIFVCPLTEFDFLFFKKLGIDQKNDFLSAVFNQIGSLYIEKKVPEGMRHAKKNQILAQIHNYFPFQENEAQITYTLQKKKKNLFLKSASLSKKTLGEFESLLHNLQFSFDHISCWQIALKEGFEFLDKQKNTYQLILVKDLTLYYLCVDDGMLISSVSFVFKTTADAAFDALKNKIAKEKHPLFICSDPGIFINLTQRLDNGKEPNFDPKWNAFIMVIGSGILAKDHQLNLASKQAYSFFNFFKNSLKFINFSLLIFSASILGLSAFQRLKQEHTIAKNLGISNRFFITENTLEQMLLEQKKITLALKNSPTSFSLSNVLNLLAMQKDPKLSLSCSFQELDLKRLDNQTSNLRCVILFQHKNAMELFEKNLRQKKLTFKKTLINPAIEYEIFLKTDTLLF